MERLVGRGAAQTVAARVALGADICVERHYETNKKLSRLSGLEVSFLVSGGNNYPCLGFCTNITM